MIEIRSRWLAIPLKGPWNEREVSEFLSSQVFPIRLASVSTDGFPRVLSLWYFFANGNLHCVTHKKSALSKILKNNGSVGFEISPNEPPYYGVRGQGIASLSKEGAPDALSQLIDRYCGGTESSLARWLLSRKEEERLITITPTRFFCWDYRKRMADVNRSK